MTSLLLALFIALAPPAVAAPHPADRAEARRIETDMTALATRNAWSGVDRQYRHMKSSNLPISVQATTLAADAALHLGDTWEAYQRFLQALAADSAAQVEHQLRTIRNDYGRVVIRRTRDVSASLSTTTTSFNPLHNASVAFAKKTLADGGTFDGMLPVGHYGLNDQRFEITAGLKPVTLSHE